MKIKNLEYFIDKICTIFTVSCNRNFKEENPATYPQPVFHYFVGKILDIDDKGILLQQWNSDKKLRSFFFLDHVISISEEELLNPQNPEDAKIIDQYKKINEKMSGEAQKKYEDLKNKQNEDIVIGENLNIDQLSSLSEKIKNG